MIFLAGDLLGDRMIRDIPDGISSDLIYTARMQITVPVYRAFRTQQSGDVFASFSRHNDFAFIHHLMERGTSETADYSSDGGKFSQQVMLDFDVACIVQIQRIDSFVVVRCQFATYPSDIKCSRCILCVQADVSPIMEMLYISFIGFEKSDNTTDVAMIRLGIGLPLHGQIAFILDADILFDKDFTIIGGPPDDSTYVGITARINGEVALIDYLATQSHFHFGAVAIQVSDKSTQTECTDTLIVSD